MPVICTSNLINIQEMKKAYLYTLLLPVMFITGMLGACSEFEPTDVPVVPALPKATDVVAEPIGRKIHLSWELPAGDNVTGVKILLNGDNNSAVTLPGRVTEYTIKGLSLSKDYLCTVKVMYEGGYISEGVSVTATMPSQLDGVKIAYLMTAPDIASLPDDDERAAAEWFAAQPDTELIYPDQIASLNADFYPVIWIEIDREGLPFGWENLPESISNEATIAALKAYSEDGGSLYLANMATQLTVPLGFVRDDMAPTVFGNGGGGDGTDVWVINPYLGWDFRDGGEQGFYDRTAHDIFKGLTLEDPNGYGYPTLPLIGPGHREDHNCMWDCNIYGKGDQIDVIINFEITTNSLVLATWGHVRDHCVAGLVEFFATSTHGRCIANGLAAYEWHQNSGDNIYQHNVEQLTANILNYLK